MTEKKEYRGSQIPSLIIGISTMFIGIMQSRGWSGVSNNIATATTLIGAIGTALSPSVKKVSKEELHNDKKDSWVTRTNNTNEQIISR